GFVAGARQDYPATIRPALQIIGVRPGVRRAAGMYMVVSPSGVRFLADTTINIQPDAETLAEIAVLVAEDFEELGLTPRIAMLSFSNYSAAPHPESKKVADAVALVPARPQPLMIDAEMQAHVAIDEEARAPYPYSRLKGP